MKQNITPWRCGRCGYHVGNCRCIPFNQNKKMICGIRCGWEGWKSECDVIDPENPKQFDPACPKCGAACEPKKELGKLKDIN